MVTIKIDGGLGNQMFQYAFIKSVAYHRNQGCQLDISSYKKNKVRGVLEIDRFNITAAFKSTYSLSKDLVFLRILRRLRISKFRGVFIETDFHYSSSVLKSSCNYFYGYFQSFKYFDYLRNTLVDELVFSPGKHSKYFKDITSCESVGVHIRRGDYISNRKVFNLMFQLNKEYYLSASMKMAEVTQKRLYFFLFSNDGAWVKENLLPVLEKVGKCVIVDHENMDHGGLYDFECLKNCKHQIIANSSFSWWAAYLNKNINGKVIAPQKWYNGAGWNSQEFYPKEWIIGRCD